MGSCQHGSYLCCWQTAVYEEVKDHEHRKAPGQAEQRPGKDQHERREPRVPQMKQAELAGVA